MLTHDEIVKQLAISMGKTTVVNLSKKLKEQKFPYRDIIDLTFHPDKQVAFRMAWLMDTLYFDDPLYYLDDIEYLLQQIPIIKYPASQRHYSRIVLNLTFPKAPKAIQEKLADIDLEPVVEHFFDWMIDPKVKVAVKVFVAESIFNLRDRYPWVTEELADQIRYMMRDGTAGIQSMGKKLLKGLSK
ncbi:hypothetical protein GCM10027049_11720 [Mucilaginibacter puniceus]